jgi:hypothetical protein
MLDVATSSILHESELECSIVVAIHAHLPFFAACSEVTGPCHSSLLSIRRTLYFDTYLHTKSEAGCKRMKPPVGQADKWMEYVIGQQGELHKCLFNAPRDVTIYVYSSCVCVFDAHFHVVLYCANAL